MSENAEMRSSDGEQGIHGKEQMRQTWTEQFGAK